MFTKQSFFTLIIFLGLSTFKLCSGVNETISNVDINKVEDVTIVSVKPVDEVPLVQVKQGLIKGLAEKSLNGRDFYSYMSIPFAQPPEGKLRFKAPVPLESWNDVLDGTKMPSSCLQRNMFSTSTKVILEGTEDCLYLNVFTPKTNESEKLLPVMVFIHGGAFVAGAAGQYLPHVLMDEDIVLVVIQYRLGIFGFLSTEDSMMPGNMGLKDQQLALKWIKENIEFFGGDSNKITIFGESAGAASVHYQVLSPGSMGLFNRAVIQSGTSLSPWASNKDHRKFAVETGQKFNCSILQGSEKYLECMQNVDPHFLTIAATQRNLLGIAPYQVLPRVDGEFIEEAPEILMKKGKYNKVDIIQGVTRDEGAFELLVDYFFPKRRENINKYYEELGPITLLFQDEENSLELTNKVYKHYLHRENVTTTKEDWKKIIDMNTDRKFKVDHDIVSNFFAADQNISLFTYQLNHKANISYLDALPGFEKKDVISHADDLPYFFYGGQVFKQKFEYENDLKMRQIFLNLWTNFAKTGNPTPSGSNFTWEEATPENFRHLSLTPTPVMKEDDFQEKRKFWSTLKTSQNLLLHSNLSD